MTQRITELSSLLNNIGEVLDIPESKYIEAKDRYNAVSNWLSADESELKQYSPEIYPQGSFRLGTVIKPLDREEYDVDLVCFLSNISSSDIAQSELKKNVGDRLKVNGTYKKILLPEGRRCWTLDYANEFHMDILPSIANFDLRAKGGYYRHAILITDQEKIREGGFEWLGSNPKGYAEWFAKCQEKIFKKSRLALMEAAQLKDIEDIPEYRVRTPLQRTIQLLKRHRDIYFKEKNHKPISMIVTTLAAQSYVDSEESYLYQALYDILQSMPNYIQRKSGKYYIGNPVNEGENFADKWNESPLLAKSFYEWHRVLVADFIDSKIIEKNISESANLLQRNLGEDVIRKAYGKTKSPDIRITGPAVITRPKVSPAQHGPWGF